VVEVIMAFVEGRPIAPAKRSRTPPEPDLTGRELEVLRLIASGSTNEQIAGRLDIVVKTVERHVTNVYRKLGAGGRADATRAAVAMDLV
jgi:DNA-binding NarL/FixJ family response regulator